MISNCRAVDFYDDGGHILREKFGADVPGFIKEAALLTEEDRGNLPDHAFAVVLVDGPRKLRKFACVDKAHTALSAIYLMERAKDLPYEARSVAAHNIKVACKKFGLKPPSRLSKMAARTRRLIDTDGPVPTVSKVKMSDLTGTDIMPLSGGGTRKLKKIASELVPPYVDVRRDAYPVPVAVDRTTYALEDDSGPQFPLDSYAQVKEAADFFNQQGRRFHPRRRHEACVKIAARADVLGIPLDDATRRYGATTYAPEGQIKVGFETRRQLFRDKNDDGAISLLDKLMEKRASAQPEQFAEALAEFDISLGISRYWDKAIPDPWLTTFGPEKRAEWVWQHGNEKLKADQLQALLKAGPGRSALERSFGAELVESMSKNPIQIFESLPLDQKIVIARMAYQG